jgi:hypothetical protein
MIRIDKYFAVFAVALIVLMWCSCTQDRQACLTPKTASLLMKSVRKNTDSSVIDTPFKAAVFAPLTGPDISGVLYSQSSSFTLSLSPQADSCTWLFVSDTAAGAAIDTITFFYDRELNFISNACGYSYTYSVNTTRTTHNTIDSVTIKNASVTNNVNTNNILLYIHPNI